VHALYFYLIAKVSNINYTCHCILNCTLLQVGVVEEIRKFDLSLYIVGVTMD
jgi:hypothetical protein